MASPSFVADKVVPSFGVVPSSEVVPSSSVVAPSFMVAGPEVVAVGLDRIPALDILKVENSKKL